MLYERKIKYLDYYEGGEKLRGGGFVKLELRENKLCLDITVRSLYPTDTFVRDVMLRSGGTEAALGQISIHGGYGSFQYSGGLDEELGHTGIVYAALREIRIPIGGTRELICSLSEAARTYQGQVPASRKSAPQVPPEEVPSEAAKAGTPVIEIPELESAKRDDSQPSALATESVKPEISVLESFAMGITRSEASASDTSRTESARREKSEAENSATEIFRRKTPETETSTVESNMRQISGSGSSALQTVEAEISASEARASQTLQSDVHLSENGSVTQSDDKEEKQSFQKGKAAPKLLEDKWQQLSAIYPHIQPFKDERDYLSISPSDFVLFPSKFYKAVNNSFLLHGYYNYNHLILARMEHRGEVIYYIGVPGNFFDREKQVAVMFGFESFECAAEPAKTGDFGYYMMRMEL